MTLDADAPQRARATRPAAVELYGSGLAEEAPATIVRSSHGRTWPLPLARYLGPLTAADEDALARAKAPVLDVGCGPGRHALALGRGGTLAVGIDVSPVAVRIARERGASVLHGSVFDHVPGAGAWGTALLLDGNIGIGGRPTALLTRLASLLRPRGRVIVELEPPGTPSGRSRVRLESGEDVSRWFAWAHVGTDAIARHAAGAGLSVTELWERDGRRFACLKR